MSSCDSTKSPALAPELVVSDATAAATTYLKAFGGKELRRFAGPDGKRMYHLALQFESGAEVWLADDFPEHNSGKSSIPTVAQSVTLNLNFESGIEKVWATMVDAGFTVTMPLDKQFWGAIYGRATCPFGHSWSLHQHIDSDDHAAKKAKVDEKGEEKEEEPKAE